MRLKRLMQWFAVTLAMLLGTSVLAASDTRWFRLELGGVQAGWRRVVETSTDTRLQWTTTEFLRINRGGQVLEIEAQIEWITDLDGRPIEVRTRQVLGDAPSVSTWRFGEDQIEITTVQGGRTHTSEVPSPTEPWLTPPAARTFVAAQGDAGADVMNYGTILPELGAAVVQQRLERLGTETVHWQGQALPATRWTIETKGLPFTGEQLLSSDWRPLGGVMHLPFGALSDAIAGPEVQHLTGDTPELFTSLFVKPQGDLGGVHQQDRLLLRLHSKDGSDIKLEASGAQTIAGRGQGHITILVDPSAPLPVADDEATDPAFREPSSLIDSSDPNVRQLVFKAVPQRDANWPRRAEAMRDFVRRWVRTKGLSTAFASASETAQTREGDCSEHAVLLAAMLRADGIPSRVATGLVWIDWADAFGWHMWTQAMLHGRWVDLDATLPMAYSPGHILVSTSALADGDGQGELIGLLGLLGNLQIEVAESGP